MTPRLAGGLCSLPPFVVARSEPPAMPGEVGVDESWACRAIARSHPWVRISDPSPRLSGAPLLQIGAAARSCEEQRPAARVTATLGLGRRMRACPSPRWSFGSRELGLRFTAWPSGGNQRAGGDRALVGTVRPQAPDGQTRLRPPGRTPVRLTPGGGRVCFVDV